jgi:hypothetical protein
MSRYYRLNKDHSVESISDDDIQAWAQDFNDHPENKIVEHTVVGKGVGVSTVFLGINHAFDDYADPILFETMVFGGDHNDHMERYTTWDEAVKGHEKIVKMCGGRIKEDDEVINNRFDILDL